MRKKIAVIVAGGSGSRFGGPVPKQFLELAGKPVLMHTIEKFSRLQPVSIILVLPQGQFGHWRQLCEEYALTVPHRVVAGGESRFHSVKNALDAVDVEVGDLVAVHDGVRPLVSVDLIDRLFTAAAECGAAIPVVPMTDSVRLLNADGSSRALPRALLRAVQTPQAFDGTVLKAAYDVPFSPDFTDDASVVEMTGKQVKLVDGETTNIKITHPLDIVVAEDILNHHS